MNKVPVRLERDPIVEATFELRFQTKSPTASDLLPGLLYPKFKDRFKTPERLAAADFPRQLLELNPELAYQPRMRLLGDRCSLFVGDRSIIVSCPKPYLGWQEFRPLLLEVVEALTETDLISLIERFSLKYVNLLVAKNLEEQFSFIRMSAKLGSYDLTARLTSVTSEIKEDDLITLIELKSGAIVKTAKNEVLSGLFIAVDAISVSPESFWEKKAALIEKVHSKEKQVFFDLLSEETTNKLGAVWQ